MPLNRPAFPGNRTMHLRRAGSILLIGALAATLVVPILLGGRPALDAVMRFPLHGYLALFAVIATSWLSRAAKLHLLLHRLGVKADFGKALAISLASDFAFMATPGGIGGYAACVFYLRRAGASMGGATMITAADQAADVVFFALAVPLAALTLLDAHLPDGWAIAARGVGAVLLALMLVVILARHRLSALLFEPNGISARWPRWQRHQHSLRAFFASLRAQMRMLATGGPAFLGAIFGLTALQSLARYGVLWLALYLLGHAVPFALTLLLQTIVLNAAQWTGVPAGGGSAEIGLTATLATWVPAAGLAAALLLWRMATLYATLVAGLGAIVWMSRAWRPHAQPTVVEE